MFWGSWTRVPLAVFTRRSRGGQTRRRRQPPDGAASARRRWHSSVPEPCPNAPTLERHIGGRPRPRSPTAPRTRPRLPGRTFSARSCRRILHESPAEFRLGRTSDRAPCVTEIPRKATGTEFRPGRKGTPRGKPPPIRSFRKARRRIRRAGAETSSP